MQGEAGLVLSLGVTKARVLLSRLAPKKRGVISYTPVSGGTPELGIRAWNGCVSL